VLGACDPVQVLLQLQQLIAEGGDDGVGDPRYLQRHRGFGVVEQEVDADAGVAVTTGGLAQLTSVYESDAVADVVSVLFLFLELRWSRDSRD